jgi:hypothetical protein
MGDIAESMLDGTLCCSCGDFIGLDSGYPEYCSECASQDEGPPLFAKKQTRTQEKCKTKATCVHCNKRVKTIGMSQHIKVVHPCA